VKEWTAFLEKQKDKLGEETLNRWAKSLKIVNFDAGNLYLEASDPFQLDWFEQYLRPLLKTSFQNMNGRPIRVYVSLAGNDKAPAKKRWKPPLDLTPDPIFSTCTFATYFAGEGNHINLQLFQEALTKKSFNPIYLQGPPGTGKTHLLMSACHWFREKGLRYFYVKADRFTEHIVAAIRSGAMIQLRKLYREHDVLVIDNVETLANRSASQEELFHTFNTFHLAGKPILLAGTKIPSQMAGIEPRLTSRFEWGLMLSLSPMAENDRSHYFEKRLLQKGISLEPSLRQHCLSLFHSVSLLNRAIDILEVRIKNEKPTNAIFQIWFKILLQEQERKAITAEVILKSVSEHFDILLTDLQGKSQTQEMATPRQIAMYLCRKELHLPFMKIAELFSRDHSTVMTSVKLIEKRLEDTPPIKEAIESILKKI
jgi:chromosomal replication initiator protein